jgi:hypothetical protein
MQDLERLLENMLGPKVFRPVVAGIRSRLRSAKQDPDPRPMRKTPRFLLVVASPDDEQERRLWPDNVVTLKWNAVRDNVGQAADIARESIVTIH